MSRPHQGHFTGEGGFGGCLKKDMEISYSSASSPGPFSAFSDGAEKGS